MQPSSHARRIALFLLIVLAIAGATLVIRHRRAAHKVAAAPVLAAQVDGRRGWRVGDVLCGVWGVGRAGWGPGNRMAAGLGTHTLGGADALGRPLAAAL